MGVVVEEAEALVRWCLVVVLLLYSSMVDGQWEGVLEETVLLPPYSQLVHLLHAVCLIVAADETHRCRFGGAVVGWVWRVKRRGLSMHP